MKTAILALSTADDMALCRMIGTENYGVVVAYFANGFWVKDGTYMIFNSYTEAHIWLCDNKIPFDSSAI